MDVGQGSAAGKSLEFLNGTDADDFLAIVTDPDRDWVSPISVSGETPVARVFQPVVEALLLDEAGDPAGRLVELNKPVLDLCDFDEPAIEATVDERSL